MKKIVLFALPVVMLFLLMSAPCMAGENAIGLAAGYGEFDSAVYGLSFQHHFDPWLEGESASLSPLIDAALTAWSRHDRTIWGGALGAGFSLDFNTGKEHNPFIAISVAPIWLSHEKYARLDLGSNILFRNKISFGLLFGGKYRRSLSLDIVHYSNANTNKDNPGFNAIGLGYGVRF